MIQVHGVLCVVHSCVPMVFAVGMDNFLFFSKVGVEANAVRLRVRFCTVYSTRLVGSLGLFFPSTYYTPRFFVLDQSASSSGFGFGCFLSDFVVLYFWSRFV